MKLLTFNLNVHFPGSSILLSCDFKYLSAFGQKKSILLPVLRCCLNGGKNGITYRNRDAKWEHGTDRDDGKIWMKKKAIIYNRSVYFEQLVIVCVMITY